MYCDDQDGRYGPRHKAQAQWQELQEALNGITRANETKPQVLSQGSITDAPFSVESCEPEHFSCKGRSTPIQGFTG